MKALKIPFLLFLFLFACNQQQNADQVKVEIQEQLNKCVEAVNSKDIELYMDQIPDDFVIYDDQGELITREKQKAYVLRDWAIIDTTLSNRFWVDSLQLMGDSAIAFTSQKWERMMFRPDGINTDTVLTTQKHRETWKKTAKGWLNYDVKELGGEIYINGLKYDQQKQ